MPVPVLSALQYIPIAFETTTELGRWFFRNREELGESFSRIRETVFSAVSDGPTRIDRVGAAIISTNESGTREVIGLLHRQGNTLAGVQTAVDGLTVGHAATTVALSGLTTLSAIGLGVTVLSQVALMAQYRAHILKAAERP